MYDWIIEADIVRLKKQISAAESIAERKRLVELLEHKRRQLPVAPVTILALQPRPRRRSDQPI